VDDSLINELRRRKQLRFDEAVDPRRLREGEVAKVVGTVRPTEEPYWAPFTERRCVAFLTRPVATRRDQVFIQEETELAQDFWLDADTGSVLVRPRGWVRFLVLGTHRSRAHPEAWGSYERFAERYGAHYRQTFAHFADGMTFFEAVVEVGMRVAVVGRVGAPFLGGRGARGGGYRQAAGAPSLEPPADGRLWISEYESHLR